MKKIFLLAVVLCAVRVNYAEAAGARVVSTQELASSCELVTEPEHRAFCIGFFSGAYETYLVTRHPQVGKAFICPSQPAPKRDEVIAEFVTWSKGHKQFDSEPAADNVLRFLAQRFPCKG